MPATPRFLTADELGKLPKGTKITLDMETCDNTRWKKRDAPKPIYLFDETSYPADSVASHAAACAAIPYEPAETNHAIHDAMEFMDHMILVSAFSGGKTAVMQSFMAGMGPEARMCWLFPNSPTTKLIRDRIEQQDRERRMASIAGVYGKSQKTETVTIHSMIYGTTADRVPTEDPYCDRRWFPIWEEEDFSDSEWMRDLKATPDAFAREYLCEFKLSDEPYHPPKMSGNRADRRRAGRPDRKEKHPRYDRHR
jgi:hypothetical protein